MARWQRREFSLSERREELAEKRIHFQRARRQPPRLTRPLWWLIILLIIIWLLYLYLRRIG